MTVDDKVFQSRQLIEMEQSEPIPLESASTLTAYAGNLKQPATLQKPSCTT